MNMNWLPTTWEQGAGATVVIGSAVAFMLWTSRQVREFANAVSGIKSLVPVAPKLAKVPTTLETIQETANGMRETVEALEDRVKNIEGEVTVNGGGSMKDAVRKIALEVVENRQEMSRLLNDQTRALVEEMANHRGK